MTAAMKVIWAKPASGILPCTASGTPAARRATAPAVVTAAARTPTETAVRGSVLVNRDGTCSPLISGEAPTYQWMQNTGSGYVNAIGGSGATSASYTTPATAVSQSGTLYECVVTNSQGTVT